jgi:hypothetical protein
VTYRDLYTSDDIVVRMTQQSFAIPGTGTVSVPNLAMRMQMVGCRISGGTIDSGTVPYTAATVADPQRLVDPSGYFFGFVSDTSKATWFIIKLVSGTIYELASEDFNLSPTGTLTDELDPFSAFWITIDVQTDGGTGDVDIVGSVSTPNAALPIAIKNVLPSNRTVYSTVNGGQALEVPLSVTDDGTTGGVPLTTGRIGFISSASSQGSGARIYTLIPEFRVQLQSVGGWYMVDEFKPFEKDQQVAYVPDDPGFEGLSAQPRDLRGGWGGGYYAIQSQNGALAKSTLGGYLDDFCQTTVSVGDETTGGKYGCYRPATDDRSSNRNIFFYFHSVGTAPDTASGEFRQAGIGARATRMSLGAIDQGYEINVRHDEGSLAGRVYLRRWHASGTHTLIAEAAQTIALDTDYALRLKVYNIPDSGGNQDGIVVIEAFLDAGSTGTIASTQIALVAASPPAAGVQIVGTGTVWDSGTNRVVSGSGEWFRATSGFAGTGSRRTLIDAWHEESLTTTPGDPEGEQATIAVSSETTGHLTGTEWTNDYDWPLEERLTARRRDFQFDSGQPATLLLDEQVRRVWMISANATTEAQRDELRTLWTSANGTELSFEFTPPDETAVVKVHFTSPALDTVLKAPGVYGFSFEIEQVF